MSLPWRENGSDVSIAILADQTTGQLRNVTARADSSATSIVNPAAIAIQVSGAGSALTLEGVTALANGSLGNEVGLLADTPAVITARQSVFSGPIAISGSGNANLIATQLDGGNSLSGIGKCVGAYNGAFVELNPTCLP